jgi:hypothetical protein
LALVNAPFGHATKAIRKYDPLYGRAVGEKINWRVRCEAMRTTGIAEVEASSAEDAAAAAADLSFHEVDWDGDEDSFRILSIEPYNRD